VGALAGPALAAEIVASRPTALVIASPHQALCTQTQDALHSDICRIYTSSDLPGVELAGAMVLILAMVVGIGDGLDLGIGARAVISTRGMAEATRLGLTLGAQAATFSGLAGSGDLVSSASHADHPSYTAGMAIAHGAQCPPELLDPISSVLALAGRQGVEMPLTEAVLTIASGKARPRLVFDQLMRRQPRSE
jgi:glycerol-3-phosphate dehydrogenase (NAD(P)+)